MTPDITEDRLRDAIADELMAHGEFGTNSARNHDNARKAADAVLAILLAARKVEPVAAYPELLNEAIRCDLWPQEMHAIVDQVIHASDHGDLSTEQCIALGVLLSRRAQPLASRAPGEGEAAVIRRVLEHGDDDLTEHAKRQAAPPPSSAPDAEVERLLLDDFAVGDFVQTNKGAQFRGKVLATYGEPGKRGAVVEAVDEGFTGTRHVYPQAQLIRCATLSNFGGK